jgi:cobalamin biosynthesis Co2+ chelatase CbiK
MYLWNSVVFKNFVVLGIKPKALHMLSKQSTTELHLQPLYLINIREYGYFQVLKCLFRYIYLAIEIIYNIKQRFKT